MMKKLLNLLIGLAVIVSAVALVPLPAWAADCGPPTGDCSGGCGGPHPGTPFSNCRQVSQGTYLRCNWFCFYDALGSQCIVNSQSCYTNSTPCC
jgi:hypothetical protein